MTHSVEGLRSGGPVEAHKAPARQNVLSGHEPLPFLQASSPVAPMSPIESNMRAPRFSRRVLLQAVAFGAVSKINRLFNKTSDAASAVGMSESISPSVLPEIRFAPEPEDVSKSAEVAGLAGEANFGLPVTEDKRDERIKHVGLPRFTVDDALKTENPYGLPIVSIGYSDRYSKWGGRNRGGVVTANALIRAHAISQKYLGEDYDYAKLYALNRSGQMPSDPDWIDYVNRLRDGEDFEIPVFALPEGAPATVENLQWMNAKLRKGITFNASAHQGFIHYQYNNDNSPLDGWSYILKDDGELQIDVWNNYAAFYGNGMNIQFTHEYGFATTALCALFSLESTLGIMKPDGAPMYQQDTILGYNKLLEPRFGMTIHQEQADLMVGGTDDANRNAYYPERLIKVNLRQ